jgi:hypothetical protein
MSYTDAPVVYNDKKSSLESNYGVRSSPEAFYDWRDAHVLSEIYLYDWVIDYWMDGVCIVIRILAPLLIQITGHFETNLSLLKVEMTSAKFVTEQ